MDAARKDFADMSTSRSTSLTGSETRPAFWASPVKVQKMAAQQGVVPVENIDDLRGEFWPEWESVEEFEETIRQWRS
jgi:hypothetical protein